MHKHLEAGGAQVLLMPHEKYSVARGPAQVGSWCPWRPQRTQVSECDGLLNLAGSIELMFVSRASGSHRRV